MWRGLALSLVFPTKEACNKRILLMFGVTVCALFLALIILLPIEYRCLEELARVLSSRIGMKKPLPKSVISKD